MTVFNLVRMLKRRREGKDCGETTAADGKMRFVFSCDLAVGHKGKHRCISDGGGFDKKPAGTILKEWR
jgi:hypothetical protein